MQEQYTSIKNFQIHWSNSLQAAEVFSVSNYLICFWVLAIVLTTQYLDIQQILPYAVPLLVAFIIGIISKIYPQHLALSFFAISIIGIQLLLYLIQFLIDEEFQDQVNQSNRFEKFGIVFYMFGIVHMAVATSISNIYFKMVFIVISYESSLFLIYPSLFLKPICGLAQVFLVNLMVLFYFKESQKNNVTQYFINIFNRFKETYKVSCDSVIVKSCKKNKYDIVFSENSLNKYFISTSLNSSQKPQTSTRSKIVPSHDIFSRIQIFQIQFLEKTKLGGDQWLDLQSLDQNGDKQCYNLDYLVKFLYEKQGNIHIFLIKALDHSKNFDPLIVNYIYNLSIQSHTFLIESKIKKQIFIHLNFWKYINQINFIPQNKLTFQKRFRKYLLFNIIFFMIDLWESRLEMQIKSLKLNLRRYQSNQQDKLNTNFIRKQEQQVCKFVIKNLNLNGFGNTQNENSGLQVYDGKIFINKNPFTKERYLKIFISKNSDTLNRKMLDQRLKTNQIDSLNYVNVSLSAINDILNIPLRQSINEILAKISLIQNNKKNILVKQTSFGQNLDYSLSSKYQKQLRVQHSSSLKNLPNQVKMDNNLTILYQNILYLQSILQYQHSYIQTQFLNEEIQIKIQKFSLQEFLEELKGIITTQFYSYLLNFNLEDQSREKDHQTFQLNSSINSKLRFQLPNSNQKVYMYTDLSVLRLIIIIICERIVKANNFEKQQCISLIIKDEGNNSISFTLKFPEISRKLFINSYLEQSLYQLGSTTGFQQSWQLNQHESIIMNSNNNTTNYPSPDLIPTKKHSQDESIDQISDNMQNKEKVNQIRFVIFQDLSHKKKNVDAMILDKLRQEGDIDGQIPRSPPKEQLNQFFSDDSCFTRPRKQSKYRHYKLEYLVESLNFDQYETVFSGTTEPFENIETETYLQTKKPSLFQPVSLKNNNNGESQSYIKQNQIKVINPNRSQREINNTKTVFIILESLQSKDDIEQEIQNKYKHFTNIYEFQSLLECNDKLKNELITPDIFVLDANNFINSQSNYFSQIFKYVQKNCKNQFMIYIFNNEQEEHQELQSIFNQPSFKVIKYSEIDSFLDE